eukprot:5472531-Prymnesium_polylepis.1
MLVCVSECVSGRGGVHAQMSPSARWVRCGGHVMGHVMGHAPHGEDDNGACAAQRGACDEDAGRVPIEMRGVRRTKCWQVWGSATIASASVYRPRDARVTTGVQQGCESVQTAM